MKLIVISGHAQHGKDTIGQMMKESLEESGRKVLITHYADLLKFILRYYFGWDGEKDEHGRSLIQYVGTDIVRRQDENFWVDFIAKMLKFSYGNWDYVIIPDCRFKNEIGRFVERGFDVTHVRVKRTPEPHTLTKEQANHPSETELDDVKPDHWFYNTGSVEDLKKNVQQYIKEIL